MTSRWWFELYTCTGTRTRAQRRSQSSLGAAPALDPPQLGPGGAGGPRVCGQVGQAGLQEHRPHASDFAGEQLVEMVEEDEQCDLGELGSSSSSSATSATKGRRASRERRAERRDARVETRAGLCFRLGCRRRRPVYRICLNWLYRESLGESGESEGLFPVGSNSGSWHLKNPIALILRFQWSEFSDLAVRSLIGPPEDLLGK